MKISHTYCSMVPKKVLSCHFARSFHVLQSEKPHKPVTNRGKAPHLPSHIIFLYESTLVSQKEIQWGHNTSMFRKRSSRLQTVRSRATTKSTFSSESGSSQALSRNISYFPSGPSQRTLSSRLSIWSTPSPPWLLSLVAPLASSLGFPSWHFGIKSMTSDLFVWL